MDVMGCLFESVGFVGCDEDEDVVFRSFTDVHNELLLKRSFIVPYISPQHQITEPDCPCDVPQPP